jgi:hypothetical protein
MHRIANDLALDTAVIVPFRVVYFKILNKEKEQNIHNPTHLENLNINYVLFL